MATQYTNDQTDLYTTIDTAPDRYITKTGSISSTGMIVTGIGTLFTTEIGGGSNQVGLPTLISGEFGYLFNGTDEVRKIKSVVSDTLLVLENGFTSNLIASLVKFVPQPKAIQTSYLNQTAGNTVNGVAIPANGFSGFGFTSPTEFVVDPIIINGSTGNGIIITKLYQGSR